MGQLQAVTKELAAAHRRGPRSENSRILDELVELASCTVTTPERRCRAAETLKVARPRRPRAPKHGPDVAGPHQQ
jgi:hypothetical protein